MQTPSLSDRETPAGRGPGRDNEQRLSRGALRVFAGGVLGLLLVGTVAGCGAPGQQGDCGPYLSSAECQTVRSQLGSLDPRPPQDPTNRFARCVRDNSAECLLEDAAAALGQRLFYDRCLSINNNVACVTCHQPSQAFTDNRVRPLTIPLTVGTTTVRIPPLQSSTPGTPTTQDMVSTAPPAVQAMQDEDGNALAMWNATTNMWVGVPRRPLASLGSGAGTATARHAPGLYNLSYGGGITPPAGERTYGVTWTPWDGRYDSIWSLVNDVWEFGATQSSDRAHIAIRIGQKHRMWYEAMIGGTLYDFDAMQTSGGIQKYTYLRHGSPTYAVAPYAACWYSGQAKDCPANVMVPTDAVRNNVNEVFVNAGKALAAYIRRLRSTNSPYDQWLAGDENAMSAAAQRGLHLFVGKAECILCHNGPNFSDFRFHNLGIPQNDVEKRVAGSAVAQPPDEGGTCFDGLGPTSVCPDPGREAWQLRADGQCPTDKATIAGKPVTCQRVDYPDSLSLYDVAQDCRSAASDAMDKNNECLPASASDPTMYSATATLTDSTATWTDSNKCAYADSTSCAADQQCQWIDTGPAGFKARCVAVSWTAEQGQFKTPSLRNVGMTFPYMHNGMLADYGPSDRGEATSDDPTPHLTKVVNFYNGGGRTPDVGTLDPLIHPLHLAPNEVSDLVEFLKALTDNSLFDSNDPLAQPPPGLGPNDPTDDCPDYP